MFDDSVEPIYYMASSDGGKESEKEGLDYTVQSLPTMCTSTDVGRFQRSSVGSKRKFYGYDDDEEFSGTGHQSADGNATNTIVNSNKDPSWSCSSSPGARRAGVATDEENRETQYLVNEEIENAEIQLSTNNAIVLPYHHSNNRLKNKQNCKIERHQKESKTRLIHSNSVGNNSSSKENDSIQLAYSSFPPKEIEESPCKLFGRHVTNGLTNIKCPMSREWAMLKIQEILFEAQFSKEFVPSQYIDKEKSTSSTKTTETSFHETT